MQVYFWSEVEAFARVFYKPLERQTAADHAQMKKQTQPAVDRFRGLPDEEKRQEFRDRLAAFVQLYAFLSQVIPYGDAELEMLYAFGRHLQRDLGPGRDPTVVNLGGDVDLRWRIRWTDSSLAFAN